MQLLGGKLAVRFLQSIRRGLRVPQQLAVRLAGVGPSQAQAQNRRPGLPCLTRRQLRRPPAVGCGARRPASPYQKACAPTVAGRQNGPKYSCLQATASAQRKRWLPGRHSSKDLGKNKPCGCSAIRVGVCCCGAKPACAGTASWRGQWRLAQHKRAVEPTTAPRVVHSTHTMALTSGSPISPQTPYCAG